MENNEIIQIIDNIKENIHSCFVCKHNGSCIIQKENNSNDIKQCLCQRIDFSNLINEDTPVEVMEFEDVVSNIISKKTLCKLKDSLDIIKQNMNKLDTNEDRDYSVILRNNNFSQNNSIGYVILYAVCSIGKKVRTSSVKNSDIEYLKKIINYNDKVIII